MAPSKKGARKSGGAVGNHSKARRLHKTTPASATTALKRAQVQLIADQADLADYQQAPAKDKEEVELVRAEQQAKKKKLTEWQAKADAAELAANEKAGRKKAGRASKAGKNEEDLIAHALGRHRSTPTPTPTPSTEHEVDAENEKLEHRQGSLLSQEQSRCILLSFFKLAKKGKTAKAATAEAFS